MSPALLVRLLFDCIAAGLLLVGLAYYWLGNTAHEVVGACMFLLVILHNVFNRRRYAGIARERREARGMANLVVTMLLLTAMSTLLITSVLISNTLPDSLPIKGGFSAKQIHTLAGYWALIVVAVHLGLRWPTIMNAARKLAGIERTSAMRTLALRALALAIAIQGIRSSFELAIGTKLSMQMSLEWWDFGVSVSGFFAHCVAVAGLWIVLSYYANRPLLTRTSSKRTERLSPPHCSPSTIPASAD